MDYAKLLELTVDLGYRLTECGAETFRVEESVKRIFKAYGLEGEVFAIPNCVHVSIETDEGVPLSRMRRVGEHGNDLEGVERYSGLSRRICAETPDLDVAAQWLKETTAKRKRYGIPAQLLGYFCGAFGFGLLFGGSWRDALVAGICGLLIWGCSYVLNKLGTNSFFKTITCAFIIAMFSYLCGGLGLLDYAGCAIIGGLMLLVPGLLVTNAMRDIIYGDTNSGINRIAEVLMIAVAIALGTAAAWSIAKGIWGIPAGAPIQYNLLQQLIPCFVSCLGFALVFNIHGTGVWLCILGGVVTWVVYVLTKQWVGGSAATADLVGYFCGALAASVFSEIMARIRKYPAIAYLVVSIVPLIPGSGVYYTMNYAVMQQMNEFANEGMHTAGIAGVIAVGILLASTIFRMIANVQSRKLKK